MRYLTVLLTTALLCLVGWGAAAQTSLGCRVDQIEYLTGIVSGSDYDSYRKVIKEGGSEVSSEGERIVGFYKGNNLEVMVVSFAGAGGVQTTVYFLVGPSAVIVGDGREGGVYFVCDRNTAIDSSYKNKDDFHMYLRDMEYAMNRLSGD